MVSRLIVYWLHSILREIRCLNFDVMINTQTEWKVLSNKGTGNRFDDDPIESTCVKYGDVIFMQVNSLNNRWLTGVRNTNAEGVITNDVFTELDKEFAYKWKVRSTPGNGQLSDVDPKHGQCLLRHDDIFLQVRDNRWLSGARNTARELVVTRNHLDGGDEQERPNVPVACATGAWRKEGYTA